MKKNKALLATIIGIIVLIFILTATIIIVLNTCIGSDDANGWLHLISGSQSDTKLDVNVVKEKLVVKFQEKSEYNNLKEIIYFEGDLYGKYSEENKKILLRDLTVIIDRLKNEKNGAKIALTFKYVTENERTYSGVQVVNGYTVKGTSINFSFTGEDTIKRQVLSVVDANVVNAMIKDYELEDIIANYIANSVETYNEFITEESIIATCTLCEQYNKLYWNVSLCKSESNFPIETLKIHQDKRVEYVKPPEPIFNAAQ